MPAPESWTSKVEPLAVGFAVQHDRPASGVNFTALTSTLFST